MVKVIVVAPTPVLRAGLRMMLDGPEIEVVGDAADLGQLAAGVDGAEVIIIHESIPEELASYRAGAGLLVLSENERLLNLLHALPLSGWGIVSPDAPASELQAAVVAVAQGLVVLPKPFMKGLLGQRMPIEAADTGRPLEEPLTAREQEVLELLSQGLSNKLIARQLQISEHTVKFHISSVYTKLDASSRAEAVSRGARLGLITF